MSLLGVAALHAQAQTQAESATTPRQLSVTPSVTVSETLTDNANLSSDKHSDLITQVSPSIRINSNAGRVQGYFDYSLTGLYYANGTQSNAVQQALSSAVKAELVPNFANVDASASISRQNISALGTQSPDSSLQTSNQTEVRSFNISPYIHGRLGSSVGYQVRLNYATTHTDTDQFGNSSDTGGSVHLGSDGTFQFLNWALDATRDKSGYSQGSQSESEALIGTINYTPQPDLRFSVRGGRERNNYVTLDSETSTTYGAGVKWTPSARTSFEIQADKHNYGNSYNGKLEYRTQRTVWSIFDTRSVSTSAYGGGQNSALSAYNLIYQLLTTLFPDPVDRQRATLGALQSLGINPNDVAPGGFLSNTAFLQQNRGVSFAYLGLRTTFLLAAQQSESRGLGAVDTAIGGLPAGSSLSQRALSASVSHRLTPVQTATVNLTQTRSTDLANGTHVDLLTLIGNWSVSLGPRSSVSLGARHSIAKGDAGSNYTESAVLGTFTYQF